MYQQLQQALAEKDESGFKVGTKRKWKDGSEVTKTKEGWKEDPTDREPAKAKEKPGMKPPPKAAAKPPGGLAGRLKSAIGKAAKVGSGAVQKAKEGAKKVAATAGAKVQATGAAAKAKVQAAPEAARQVSSKVAAKIKGLPAEAKRLVTDHKYRSETGKKMGEALKRKMLATGKNIVDELGELKDAGAAMKKMALRQKLDKHDKHALKEAAKTIGMTIAGTIALGGVGHITAAALSTHFAAETLIKQAGRAALFADLQRSGWPIYESDEDAMGEVVERVVAKVIQELEGLGSLSDEQMADIMAKGHEGQSSASDDEGDDEGDEDKKPEGEPEKEPEAKDDKGGSKDWKPGSHNRSVDTSKWGKS